MLCDLKIYVEVFKSKWWKTAQIRWTLYNQPINYSNIRTNGTNNHRSKHMIICSIKRKTVIKRLIHAKADLGPAHRARAPSFENFSGFVFLKFDFITRIYCNRSQHTMITVCILSFTLTTTVRGGSKQSSNAKSSTPLFWNSWIRHWRVSTVKF